MVPKPFYTDGLDGLCSKDQFDLLDSIDSLRSQGISHYVSLPQIIVCGDQSSGKSSVLEAISGVSFPIKGNLCTRFPTELVLRKTAHAGVSVSIVPDHTRGESERHALSSFHQKLDSFEGLSALIEEAKSAMGLSPHGRAFSKDILRVEVSGPDRPHLTIVDLPGLIHSETKQQSASDVELVQDLVQSYMAESRCIILAVFSAKNDYANQIVLKLARAADKMGVRTLGDIEFRLGWHVLKNMDSDKGQSSLETRDSEEERFLSLLRHFADSDEKSDQSDAHSDSQDEQELTSPGIDKHDTSLEIIEHNYADHSFSEIAEGSPCIVSAIASPEAPVTSNEYYEPVEDCWAGSSNSIGHRLKNKGKKSKVLQSRAVFEEAA
ncbi:MAG: hypothetical protein M1816_002754 [Peltula sp. TS41687]|nr:MAG: hypothetical protein M1816_002754 [Peltula sp. TS41687]